MFAQKRGRKILHKNKKRISLFFTQKYMALSTFYFLWSSYYASCTKYTHQHTGTHIQYMQGYCSPPATTLRILLAVPVTWCRGVEVECSCVVEIWVQYSTHPPLILYAASCIPGEHILIKLGKARTDGNSIFAMYTVVLYAHVNFKVPCIMYV